MCEAQRSDIPSNLSSYSNIQFENWVPIRFYTHDINEQRKRKELNVLTIVLSLRLENVTGP